METITIKVTDQDARVIASYLRTAYGLNKNTGLSKLCEIAVRRAVAAQARVELDEAEKQVSEEMK